MATKYPPALTFSEALAVIRDMFQQHGMETSMELMPKVFDISPNSSYLPRKTSALQGFGLVQKTASDDLALTELAQRILKPIGNEANEAKLESFRKIDVLSDLLAKYGDGKLPSADQLQQSLMKNYQISRDSVKAWYDFVVDSFKEISPVVESVPQRATTRSSQSTIDLSGAQNYEISVPVDSGESIKVIIPKSAATKDLKKIKALLDALTQNEE
jgi:hypothetical protein